MLDSSIESERGAEHAGDLLDEIKRMEEDADADVESDADVDSHTNKTVVDTGKTVTRDMATTVEPEADIETDVTAEATQSEQEVVDAKNDAQMAPRPDVDATPEVHTTPDDVMNSDSSTQPYTTENENTDAQFDSCVIDIVTPAGDSGASAGDSVSVTGDSVTSAGDSVTAAGDSVASADVFHAQSQQTVNKTKESLTSRVDGQSRDANKPPFESYAGTHEFSTSSSRGLHVDTPATSTPQKDTSAPRMRKVSYRQSVLEGLSKVSEQIDNCEELSTHDLISINTKLNQMMAKVNKALIDKCPLSPSSSQAAD